jgi:hypothetical protein
MIAFRPGKYLDDSARLSKAVRRAGRVALRILGYNVRKTAQASLEDVKGPSKPGQPPHTHERGSARQKRKATRAAGGKAGRPHVLPAAIIYGVETNPDRVLIGPTANVAGTVGRAFEHEGDVEFRGHVYPPRPFMAPALAVESPQLPEFLIEQLDKIK